MIRQDGHFSYAIPVFSFAHRSARLTKAGRLLASRGMAATMSLTYLAVLTLLVMTLAGSMAKAAEPAASDISQVAVISALPRGADIKPFVMAASARPQQEQTSNVKQGAANPP